MLARRLGLPANATLPDIRAAASAPGQGSQPGDEPSEPDNPWQKEGSLITHERRETTMHVGPIPSAGLMREYKELGDDFPERIVAMAEKEQAYRHTYSLEALNAYKQEQLLQTRLAQTGQILGFLLATGALLGSMLLLGAGRSIAGLATFASALAVLVGTFVYRQHVRKQIEATAGSKSDQEEQPK